MKKLLAFILCITTLCTPTCAFASESQNVKDSGIVAGISENLDSNAISAAGSLVRSWAQFTASGDVKAAYNAAPQDVTIGSRIPIYAFTVNGAPQEMTGLKKYPVYFSGEHIGTFSIHGESDESYSFSKEWKDEIDAFVSSGNNEFCAVTTGEDLYFKSDENVEFVSSYHLMGESAKSRVAKPNLNDIESMTVDGEKYSADGMRYAIPVPLEPRKAGETNCWGYCEPTELSKQKYNDCWAFTIKRLGQWESLGKYNPVLTIAQVCTKVGISATGNGASLSQVKAGLLKVYDVTSTTSSGAYSDSTIIDTIDSCYLFSVLWNDKNPSSKLGHYTVVSGYDDRGSALQILLEDSLSGEYTWFTKGATGFTYVVPAGWPSTGTQMYWAGTVKETGTK